VPNFSIEDPHKYWRFENTQGTLGEYAGNLLNPATHDPVNHFIPLKACPVIFVDS